MRIGLPRALMYYEFYPLWRTFFEGLGLEVVPSHPTTKRILEAGIKLAVDKELVEAKLPDAIVTDVFRDLLYEAKDVDARKALIEDRQKIANMASSGKPLSTEQGLTEGTEQRAKPEDVANRLRG